MDAVGHAGRFGRSQGLGAPLCAATRERGHWLKGAT